MSSQTLSLEPAYANWSAIFSLFIGVTSLVASEFLPVSLLTQIASDLNITEGMAGQSVTASGVFAVITSFMLAPLMKTVDRRKVLLSFSVLVILSNIIVAMAPNFFILLIGRCILGICVGGFWSMSSAVTLRLVSKKDIPRALSIVYAGVSFATIISIPLATYLGYQFGWRHVFYLSALLGILALIWQYFSLPSLPTYEGNSFKSLFALTKQCWIVTGIMGTIFSFAGYQVFFTYLRPFLEHDLFLYANPLTLTLLAFGVANCLGTFIAGFFLGKMFRLTMIIVHILLLSVAICLFLSDLHFTEAAILIMVWGFLFGIIPVGWSTWITRTLADKAEIAGGLMVAAIQFSITIGAALGGLVFDNQGMRGIFVSSSIIVSFAIVFIIVSFSLFQKATGRKV